MLAGIPSTHLRDFAPDKQAWVDYSTGKHFESRLAHVHLNLFAVLKMTLSATSCCTS